MVTQSDKFPCPVCGKIIQKQGQPGHNKSKFHLDALAKQSGNRDENIQSIQPKPVAPIGAPIGVKRTKKVRPNEQTKIEPKQEEEWDGYLC